MRKIFLVIAGVIILSSACKKEDPAPEYAGDIELSSERLSSGSSFVYYGFDFETGQVSTYSLSGPDPDLSCNHLIEFDVLKSVYMESSEDQNAFSKYGSYGTAAEAEASFNGYKEVVGNDFIPLAQNVEANQIWTVQTKDNKFAKLWIMESQILEGSQSKYAVLKIRYVYQPDGSRSFDCGCE